MTADIELLPLPELASERVFGAKWDDFDIQDYARANVAHATAPLQDEVEALREDVASWKAQAMRNLDLIERLAEALRDALECGEDGDWQSARNYINEALRDHDQEGDNP